MNKIPQLLEFDADFLVSNNNDQNRPKVFLEFDTNSIVSNDDKDRPRRMDKNNRRVRRVGFEARGRNTDTRRVHHDLFPGRYSGPVLAASHDFYVVYK